MRKSKFGQKNKIYSKQWMKYRPYPNFSHYDNYYLNLANKVLSYIDKPSNGFSEAFNHVERQEIAILLTCHFEDFISEIGLWDALRRKNKELYGKVIPIYDLTDYDPDYLNPQDFYYLIWQTIQHMLDKSTNPYSGDIQNLGDFCFELFEKEIDIAPAIGFYDKWKVLEEDMNFFEFKLRMKWITFENYLLGPMFLTLLNKSLNENKELEKDFFKKDIEKYEYMMQDDYLWTKPSAFCGMTAPQWLVEVSECSDQTKTQVLQTSNRVIGLFAYQDKDESHYKFEFLRTKRIFSVNKKSVDIPSSLKTDKDCAIMNLIPWGTDWWLSGIFAGYPLSQEDIEKERNSMANVSFHGWQIEQQEQIRTQIQDMETGFVEFFGSNLVYFRDENEMSTALQKQTERWNKNKTSKKSDSIEDSDFLEKESMKDSLKGMDLDDGFGLAVYFAPGEGQMISGLVPEIVQMMQKEKLSMIEYKTLFYSFFQELDYSIALELVKRYGMNNLRYPTLEEDKDFVVDNFLLLLHLNNPFAFTETTPNLSLTNF